ncbi:uncharacterized protein EV420DRAFT_1622678 [Desarmillaria tabescens]|uniref:Nucleotidyltransferase n=1 Tax=Armillaria tabescens TaxID=1929756 RepID=A0AA39JPE0_ARMTA|nr:uncharacterized protein EV420DRAFT_1622678 [Desarmillaria tabescens]KAK0445044.1 hypothetical protein EV420DRAFT_1622678 [Desarmillaria tabescens]
MTESLPQLEREYIAKLVATLNDILTNCLVAVYLFGSASYGAYEPGISDLDVQAIISSPLPRATYWKLATQLGHSAIPCPAHKLEFVLYTKDAVRAAHPQFELNFNTGDGMTDYVCLDPSQEAARWFLLDIASGREKGVALLGPPPATVFAEPRRDRVVAAIVDCIHWHLQHEPTSANTIMNACRAWRFVETANWGSKLRAGDAIVCLNTQSSKILSRRTSDHLLEW